VCTHHPSRVLHSPKLCRYVDWALTTPLLLLDLALLAGLPWIDVLALLVVDEAMILTGAFAGLHRRPNG
jgi:bacteriorhodopsin